MFHRGHSSTWSLLRRPLRLLRDWVVGQFQKRWSKGNPVTGYPATRRSPDGNAQTLWRLGSVYPATELHISGGSAEGDAGQERGEPSVRWTRSLPPAPAQASKQITAKSSTLSSRYSQSWQEH